MKSENVRAKFKDLIKKLSTDPKVKEAIASLRTRKTAKAGTAAVDGAPDATSVAQHIPVVLMFIEIIRLSAKFIGKRRARILEEWLDILALLIGVSMILKENIFDRPEVRDFFEKGWGDFKSFSRKYAKISSEFVSHSLKKVKRRARP